MEAFLICKNCNTRYDTDKKIPVVMPCGHSCCKECYFSSSEPQENRVTCPFDNKISEIPSELPTNQIVLELLRQQVQVKGPSIFCFEHEHKDVEFYCRKHNELLCSLCVWEHSDHRALVKVCTQKEIKAHTELLRKSLEGMHEKIVEKIEQGRQLLHQIENKEKQMSSKELMEGLNFVKEILIKPFYDENNEGKRIKYVIDMKDSFLLGSTLLKGDETDLVKEWFGKAYIVTELLLRGTKDGFSASTFHSKCNDKGATITIAKSHSGQIFGGYNPKSWSSNGNYANEAEAFLFSISKKAKLPLFNNHGNAIYNYASYGATWGGGHDLMFCDNCNSVNSSYSNLGYSYKPPNGISYSSTEAQNFLAGSYNFMITEIEVFKIVVSE